MRNVSQTLIGILREEISEYRRIHRKSRETIAQMVVEAHEHLGADITTGIRFEPKTVDTFERTKVNADRIFRWLDDETKDSTLLPANCLISLLAGMPEEVQRRILDRALLPLGFAVRARALPQPLVPFSAAVATQLMREQNDAAVAATGLIDGFDRSELEKAHQQASEAIDAGMKFRAMVEAHMAEAEAS
ncbi:hypothetical protein ERD78_18735 [Allopusillimonas soli]|uniref:Bacterial toxin YdaT domain-containing protein n=1 Tax=Allopusillimonas soli TaxID=659016 RepID=A0A853FLW6_9BURK|nr:hypothetical protein [Allopusillimonas soli]NYT38896.1 hypothetical protein [Allopusillimonas soli]TEA70105.1 hypothetical protein ERD78_18735 [Allopusillimonas soli]